MEKLSERLQLIADNIFDGETMADIGTDHGFLPIYLLLKKNCPFAIMADINKGPLDNALRNYEENIGNDIIGERRVDFRLGSGIEVLKPGEVDNVVIAGMGGRLMIEILQKDFEKTCSFNRYILQPRNGLGHLRHWLNNTGFIIEKELLVKELDNICNVLTVSRNADTKRMNNIVVDSEWFRCFEPSPEEEFPHKLLELQTPLCMEYLLEKLEKYRLIANNIESFSKESGRQKYSYVNQIIEHLERLVAKYD